MSERTRTVSAPSLSVLIGKWEFESTKDGGFLGRGSATFEWIEDGAFVLERAVDLPSPDTDPDWVAHSPMPVTAIIGFDDTTLEHVMLYSDARGVFRIYRMTLDSDTWQVWRAAPGFHQRYIGAIRDEGRTIQGRWESSPDGEAWEPDFDLTYRRVDPAPHR
jgi:hypothetical protein